MTRICIKCDLMKSDIEIGRNECKECRKIDRKHRDAKRASRKFVDVPESKKCSVCSIEKSQIDFFRSKVSLDSLERECKSCRIERDAKARVKRIENDPRRCKLKSMTDQAKVRSRKLGLPCDITLEWMMEKFYHMDACPALNIAFDWHIIGNSNCQASPSLDRIIPELGYIKGNVQLISYKANTMKNDASFEELQRFCEWVNRMLDNTNVVSMAA